MKPQTKRLKRRTLSRPKILVVLGPTASGKSALAVKIARKFNGEIISADSRQVYKGLDIGAGKITKREMQGVPHHLLDIISPKKVFTVEDFRTAASKAIDDILTRRKLPIICGGSGFYIQAVVDNVTFPNVEPNKPLREKLEKLSAEKLLEKLSKLDRRRAREMDPQNKRRMIRAIEIATALGKVPKVKAEPKYSPLLIGIETSPEILRQKIHARLLDRIEMGMLKEGKKLRESGLSLKRMLELGLEYRFLALYMAEKISLEEMQNQLENEIWKFSRRQMTWFKRDSRIKWFDLKKGVGAEKMEKVIEKFLK